MAKQELSTAIIIPVKSFNQRLNKCITECLKLDYSNFKIFVFPDQPFFEFKGKIEVIPTGNIGPALKRDLALKHSQAEIFAFLDDDAYPDKNWLKNALRHFQDKDTAGVGGPALTPDESPVMEKASGYVFSSVLASGKYIYRYVPKETQEVDDYPSCNFLVRREIFDRLGGFNNNFWPGEDTKLCLDITKKLGKKIIYDPQAFVFHHRRTLFFPHYKQVANYALHRGYFVKKFPETSLRFAYFLPSI
ncbi:MAG: glycosyl transferase, partial [Candidatus Omnitrophota bacterium]